MIDIKRTKMIGKVLLQMCNGNLIAYRCGSIIVYNNNEECVKTISLPIPLWKRICCKNRLGERILHQEARWAVELSEDDILLLFQNSIYRLNLATEVLEEEFREFRGRPFSVLRTEDSVLFADYGSNDQRDPVNIYQRKNEEWRIVYTFPSKSIRHIHNLIQSKDRERIYILTGDEDNESGIWISNKSFTTVIPLLKGHQQYRCCQLLLKDKDSGYYVTDAPSEQNKLYSFSADVLEELQVIPGTVIYGTPFQGGLLFSTTVEPEAHAKNKMEYWLTNIPGKGIADNKTHLFYLNSNTCQEIVSYQHDGKPLRLFQYGTIYFSNEKNNKVYFTPTCVKDADYTIHCIEMRNE